MTEVVSMITDAMDATFPALSETAKPQDKKAKGNGIKPDPKKKGVKRRNSSTANNKSNKKRAVGSTEAKLQQYNEQNVPSNLELVALFKEMHQSNNARIEQLEDRQDATELKLENTSRELIKYSLRVDGIPCKIKDNPVQIFDKIAKTLLLLNEFKPAEIKDAKFLPEKNAKKALLVTFHNMDQKKRVLDACKNLQNNKLEGEFKISISPQFTQAQLQQKHAALMTKKACEELQTTMPGFLRGAHMKLVGYNMLDDDPKKKGAKHFAQWLKKLMDLSQKQPSGYACETEPFKTAYNSAVTISKSIGLQLEQEIPNKP